MTKDEIIEGTLKALLDSREDLSRRLCIAITQEMRREELERMYPSAADLDAVAEEERVRRLTR